MKKAIRVAKHGKLGMLVVVACAVTVMVTAVLEVQGANVQVIAGQAVTIPAENVAKLAIADPLIADVIPLSEKEISVIGKKPGVTTLTVVHTEGAPTETHRLEVSNDQVVATIRTLIGQPTVNIRSVGDTIVLDGSAEDELQAQRAAQIAAAYQAKVLNLLEVKKPRQIKVSMRVAEVSSEAVKNIGFQWFGPGGEVQYAFDYNGGSILHGLVQPKSSSGTAPLTPNATDIGVDVILQLLMTKNYARVLSEPTLVTLSGQEASFLVGREIPVVQQLPQSFTVEFKEVGVRMKIKPTADSQNQINTVLHAEVSEIISYSQRFELPIIGSKKADTTLQVRDGQTVVIGGLLGNNLSKDTLRKVPWLGDIPLFGFLFRNKQNESSQTEVLFFMTPEVIKDMDAAVAGAAQTPVMKDWNGKAHENLLEPPKDHEMKPEGTKPLLTPATEKPATAEPPPAPKTNYSPARPAGP